MEGSGYGILCRSVSYKRKVMCVKQRGDEGHDVLLEELLKALNDHKIQYYEPVVIQADDNLIFGEWDYDGRFEAGWNGGQAQGLVKNPFEDPSQLICTVFQSLPWDTIGSSCFPWFDGQQCAPHFLLNYPEVIWISF